MATITADWQALVVERDFLIGRGTNYPGLGAISGIGAADIDPADIDSLGDGGTNGVDWYGARTILMPITVLGDTDDDVWANYQALAEAWRISRRADLEVIIAIPGSERSFFGRPRGAPVTLTGLKGYTLTQLAFRCADPLAYGEPVDSGIDTTSPLAIAAGTLGTEDTNRATLTLVGNGGTPIVTNDQGGTITFAQVLPLADVAVIDLRTRAVTVEGVAAPEAIDPGTPWFDLAGGATNTLSWIGAASLQVVYRPAWGTA